MVWLLLEYYDIQEESPDSKGKWYWITSSGFLRSRESTTENKLPVRKFFKNWIAGKGEKEW